MLDDVHSLDHLVNEYRKVMKQTQMNAEEIGEAIQKIIK